MNSSAPSTFFRSNSSADAQATTRLMTTQQRRELEVARGKILGPAREPRPPLLTPLSHGEIANKVSEYVAILQQRERLRSFDKASDNFGRGPAPESPTGASTQPSKGRKGRPGVLGRLLRAQIDLASTELRREHDQRTHGSNIAVQPVDRPRWSYLDDVSLSRLLQRSPAVAGAILASKPNASAHGLEAGADASMIAVSRLTAGPVTPRERSELLKTIADAGGLPGSLDQPKGSLLQEASRLYGRNLDSEDINALLRARLEGLKTTVDTSSSEAAGPMGKGDDSARADDIISNGIVQQPIINPDTTPAWATAFVSNKHRAIEQFREQQFEKWASIALESLDRRFRENARLIATSKDKASPSAEVQAGADEASTEVARRFLRTPNHWPDPVLRQLVAEIDDTIISRMLGVTDGGLSETQKQQLEETGKPPAEGLTAAECDWTVRDASDPMLRMQVFRHQLLLKLGLLPMAVENVAEQLTELEDAAVVSRATAEAEAEAAGRTKNTKMPEVGEGAGADGLADKVNATTYTTYRDEACITGRHCPKELLFPAAPPELAEHASMIAALESAVLAVDDAASFSLCSGDGSPVSGHSSRCGSAKPSSRGSTPQAHSQVGVSPTRRNTRRRGPAALARAHQEAQERERRVMIELQARATRRAGQKRATTALQQYTLMVMREYERFIDHVVASNGLSAAAVTRASLYDTVVELARTREELQAERRRSSELEERLNNMTDACRSADTHVADLQTYVDELRIALAAHANEALVDAQDDGTIAITSNGDICTRQRALLPNEPTPRPYVEAVKRFSAEIAALRTSNIQLAAQATAGGRLLQDRLEEMTMMQQSLTSTQLLNAQLRASLTSMQRYTIKLESELRHMLSLRDAMSKARLESGLWRANALTSAAGEGGLAAGLPALLFQQRASNVKDKEAPPPPLAYGSLVLTTERPPLQTMTLATARDAVVTGLMTEYTAQVLSSARYSTVDGILRMLAAARVPAPGAALRASLSGRPGSSSGNALVRFASDYAGKRGTQAATWLQAADDFSAQCAQLETFAAMFRGQIPSTAWPLLLQRLSNLKTRLQALTPSTPPNGKRAAARSDRVPRLEFLRVVHSTFAGCLSAADIDALGSLTLQQQQLALIGAPPGAETTLLKACLAADDICYELYFEKLEQPVALSPQAPVFDHLLRLAVRAGRLFTCRVVTDIALFVQERGLKMISKGAEQRHAQGVGGTDETPMDLTSLSELGAPESLSSITLDELAMLLWVNMTRVNGGDNAAALGSPSALCSSLRRRPLAPISAEARPLIGRQFCIYLAFIVGGSSPGGDITIEPMFSASEVESAASRAMAADDIVAGIETSLEAARSQSDRHIQLDHIISATMRHIFILPPML